MRGVIHLSEDGKKCVAGLVAMKADDRRPIRVFVDSMEASLYVSRLNESEGRAEYYSTAVDVCLGEWKPPMQTCFYVRDHQGVAGNWFSKCSNCGEEFDERVVRDHFIYCPACGAKLVEQG